MGLQDRQEGTAGCFITIATLFGLYCAVGFSLCRAPIVVVNSGGGKSLLPTEQSMREAEQVKLSFSPRRQGDRMVLFTVMHNGRAGHRQRS